MNVPELFRESARQYSDRPAIAFSPDHKLSYAQLDHLSDLAANYLLDKGVTSHDRLGLCLEKSASFYILCLAALKVGAAYFALDPRNPPARMEAILDQCRPRLIFSHEALGVPAWETFTVACPREHGLPDFCSDRPGAPRLDLSAPKLSDSAYLMFTSGSTGTPKGAVMSQGNLVSFIRWVVSAYGFTPQDVHTHLNPVFFDNSVFDIYSTLFSGGCLVPFTYEVLMHPTHLAERIRQMRCTVWFSVPSLLMYLQVMKVVTPDYFSSLRLIIFGGEGFPKAKLKTLRDSLRSGVELHNVSGPTECTCIATTYRVTDADFQDLNGLPALGEVIPTLKGYLLDGDQGVPDGDIGELCLAGPCVGLGYFNEPALTQKVFTQNPLKPLEKETIYRSGDLVRRDARDGKLYFVGRRDLQVKHQGYRIELEEIQQGLSRCHGVDDNAVFYRRREEEGMIVAAVAASYEPDLKALRLELEKYIPKYMMPARFRFFKQLPKNANGKTDRLALEALLGD